MLRSRINVEDLKEYYEKNEENQRKTLHPDDLEKIETNNTSRDKIFENAGAIKNADYRADTNLKNKELLEAEFAQYEVDIIHSRNNKMFGITQVLPL